MAKMIGKLDKKRFNLKSFADLLSSRSVIIGEEPGGFETFHAGLMQSLAPATAYERVIAENLTRIEWELLQHQRMRNMNLHSLTRNAIISALVEFRRDQHEVEWDEKWDSAFEAHGEAGGTEEEWEETIAFDETAAFAEGQDLAAQAMSADYQAQSRAYAEITKLGMDPVEVMSAAYRSSEYAVVAHDNKIKELERRRREVKRDYEDLQKVRPVDAAPAANQVIEAEVLR